eukprot:scaffold40511_cov63-Phaeocystis_antarctica.AAC.6
MHSVRRRWGSVMWRSWARVTHGRLPVIGRQDGAILRHGPPPAHARGRVAVGRTEAWPQVHPGFRCLGCLGLHYAKPKEGRTCKRGT